MLFRGLRHTMLTRGLQRSTPKFWYRTPHVNRVVVCLGSTNPCESENALRSMYGLVSTWDRKSSVSIHGYHVPVKADQSTDLMNRFQRIAGKYPELQTSFEVAEASKGTKHALVKYCMETRPDLVALGAGGATHYLKLASLVEYVVRESPCDVLIVRENDYQSVEQPETEDEDGNVAEFVQPISCDTRPTLPGDRTRRAMKMMVCFGVNDWDGSIEALRAAIRLSRPGDEITVVTTPDLSTSGNAIHVVSSASADSNIDSILQGDLCEVIEDHRREDITIHPLVLPATVHPAAAICEFAKNEGMDLVATGYGGATHIFHARSFTYYIAHHAHCSVLVARQPGAVDESTDAGKSEEDIIEELRNQPTKVVNAEPVSTTA